MPRPIEYESHGLSRHYFYRLWNNIKQRCYNPKNQWHYNYGGRGIDLYAPWRKSFIAFRDSLIAEIGERPDKSYSLDRINNDGNYEPGNLRWATRKEQSENSRPKIFKIPRYKKRGGYSIASKKKKD